MKKLIYVIFAILLCGMSICGCSFSKKGASSDGKIKIVTTIFPEYDWVKELTKGNDNIEVSFLLDKGVDLHSFQPSVDDLVKVSNCDMFIYVGGESDEWVEDALSEASNKDMLVINLMDTLGDCIKEEEIVEGMEAEEEEEGDEEEGPEYDEHVWLSLKTTSKICEKIEAQLEKMDSKNASLYQANLKSYLNELDALDKQMTELVSGSSNKTLLFGDRFPFRYLVDDYGISYYAAFVGCSAESEASFETITFLSKKVDQLNLPAIMQIETADGKIAQTIKENTKNKNQSILTLDSMQATTAKDVENGASYLSIMQANIEVLKDALK